MSPTPFSAAVHSPPTDRPAPAEGSEVRREALRTRSRVYMDVADGTGTAGEGSMRPQVLAYLDRALSTELDSIRRYREHHLLARCARADSLADLFLVHAIQDQQHADWLAGRISQLGGTPDFSPGSRLPLATAQGQDDSPADMLHENLSAERDAIVQSRGFIAQLGDRDPTTLILLESILATAEWHADELAAQVQGLLEPATASGRHRDLRGASPLLLPRFGCRALLGAGGRPAKTANQP